MCICRALDVQLMHVIFYNVFMPGSDCACHNQLLVLKHGENKTEVKKDKGIYVGVKDEDGSEQISANCDGADDIWKEMAF